MKKLIFPFFLLLIIFILSFLVFSDQNIISTNKTNEDEMLYKKFQLLSRNGNSSCSSSFANSISSMSGQARLQGSCCGPMGWHRYKEQVKSLKRYINIKEIPPDPYDIELKLAQKLQSHYNDPLSKKEQEAYDYAMQNSKEKGPCCCKCWRWNVYGGLAKYLIKNYKFTGRQITDVWNLSDGCGGDEDHVAHS